MRIRHGFGWMAVDLREAEKDPHIDEEGEKINSLWHRVTGQPLRWAPPKRPPSPASLRDKS